MVDFLEKLAIAEQLDSEAKATGSVEKAPAARRSSPKRNAGKRPAASSEARMKQQQQSLLNANSGSSKRLPRSRTPDPKERKAVAPSTKKGVNGGHRGSKQSKASSSVGVGGSSISGSGSSSAPAGAKNGISKVSVSVSKELGDVGFEVLGPIAAGAFSTILRARHVASGVECAVKTFDGSKYCSEAQREERDREMCVLRLVSEADHAHIANMIGEASSPSGSIHAMLVHCGGGSLQSYLGKLRKKQMGMTELNAATVTAQMASALSFIHSLGVAHRDVKPANVLYDGHRWRLCDFGFAIVCHERLLRKVCGTLDYLAPEVVSGESYYGPSVDMWAFGCMVYEMRLGRSAFVAPDLDSLKLRIRNGFKGGSDTQPFLSHFTAPYKRLISSLLKLAPHERLSADQVLSSQWVSKHCAPTRPPPQQQRPELPPSQQQQQQQLDATVDTSSRQPNASDEPAMVVTSWWCDRAADGCLRPVERPDYPTDHACWAHNGYTVCRSCYESGQVEHHAELQMVTQLAELVPVQKAPPMPEGASRLLEPQYAGAVGAVEGADAEEKGSPSEANRLETELEALKAKHGDESRLEACLLELHEARAEASRVKEELEAAQEQLAEASRRYETAGTPSTVTEK